MLAAIITGTDPINMSFHLCCIGYFYTHTLSTVVFLPVKNRIFNHKYFEKVRVLHCCCNLKINYL
jgi:hypothetical protein